MEGEGDDVLTYTRKWFDFVNRGGLNDVTVICMLANKDLPT